MGSDLIHGVHDATARISIHAPAWGATEIVERGRQAFDISIHAPAWGATECALGDVSYSEFQSTLPHGERLNRVIRMARRSQFQSTLPHGERPDVLEALAAIVAISIHAPAWGATAANGIQEPQPAYFNPRSRMGSDNGATGTITATVAISIHAPAWGATATTDSIFRYVDDIIRYCEQCAAAVAY